MNAQQTEALNAFNSSQLREDHEIKKLNIDEWDNGQVWVTVEFGRKDDEGTLLSLINRSYFAILIGTRGSMKVRMAPKWAKGLRKVGGAKITSGCHFSG